MNTTAKPPVPTVEEATEVVKQLRRKLPLHVAAPADVRDLLAQVGAFKATLEAELLWRAAHGR